MNTVENSNASGVLIFDSIWNRELQNIQMLQVKYARLLALFSALFSSVK